VDERGQLWIVAGYTDFSSPASNMGLAVRAPSGQWNAYPPLVPFGGAFHPSGDAWLATAQKGSRSYYVSLLTTAPHQPSPDEVADGIALAIVDIAQGAPTILAPRRIDPGVFSAWDEPTVSATRPAGATSDTVIVAGTPIAPTFQDVVAVLVSHDGGQSFHQSQLIYAPHYPGRASGRPDNTVVRPFLEQDPRAGQECHVYMAFGVYYATALESTDGVSPPSCITDSSGCRSIAETESHDCGETWSPPSFIAIDTGLPGGEDYRGFSYAVADDGARFVIFGDEDVDNAPILLKRSSPGGSFSVIQTIKGISTWGDGNPEILASGPSRAGAIVKRWRPTLSASSLVGALWVEEETASHASSVWFSTATTFKVLPFGAPRLIDSAGVACDGLPFPSDDYMGVTPEATLGQPTSSFVIAWTDFSPCGSTNPRQLEFRSIP
jgi:hypothetical protein